MNLKTQVYNTCGPIRVTMCGLETVGGSDKDGRVSISTFTTRYRETNARYQSQGQDVSTEIRINSNHRRPGEKRKFDVAPSDMALDRSKTN